MSMSVHLAFPIARSLTAVWSVGGDASGPAPPQAGPPHRLTEVPVRSATNVTTAGTPASPQDRIVRQRAQQTRNARSMRV
jgi:hypothetical protein